jgi:hypothetical protein
MLPVMIVQKVTALCKVSNINELAISCVKLCKAYLLLHDCGYFELSIRSLSHSLVQEDLIICAKISFFKF